MKTKLNAADRSILEQAVYHRALAGEDPSWEELTTGVRVVDELGRLHRPSFRRVYHRSVNLDQIVDDVQAMVEQRVRELEIKL